MTKPAQPGLSDGSGGSQIKNNLEIHGFRNSLIPEFLNYGNYLQYFSHKTWSLSDGEMKHSILSNMFMPSKENYYYCFDIIGRFW